METFKRTAMASTLFVLIMLGWLGDTLLSLALRRSLLSFDEVYRSWKEQIFWMNFSQ